MKCCRLEEINRTCQISSGTQPGFLQSRSHRNKLPGWGVSSPSQEGRWPVGFSSSARGSTRWGTWAPPDPSLGATRDLGDEPWETCLRAAVFLCGEFPSRPGGIFEERALWFSHLSPCKGPAVRHAPRVATLGSFFSCHTHAQLVSSSMALRDSRGSLSFLGGPPPPSEVPERS